MRNNELSLQLRKFNNSKDSISESNLNINKLSLSFGSNLNSEGFVSSLTTDSDSILSNLNNFMLMFLVQFIHILLWKNVLLIKF